jgi:hypothetical protein
VLGGITTTHIEAYQENRRIDPGLQRTSFKVSSLNRDLALLKHMFGYAAGKVGWKEAQ